MHMHLSSAVLVAVLGVSICACDTVQQPTAVSNSAPAVRAGVDPASSDTPVAEAIPFKFFDQCSGDTVSGAFITKTSLYHFSLNGATRVDVHYVVSGSAVGQPSGATYTMNETTHDGATYTNGGNRTETVVYNLHWISKGSTDNIVSHVLLHITVHADGTVTKKLSSTESCTGK